MEGLNKNLSFFRLLMSIWFISIFFTAVMYTLGLLYNLNVVIILSGVTGLISLIGAIYTGYSIIRIKNSIKYFEEKNRK